MSHVPAGSRVVRVPPHLHLPRRTAADLLITEEGGGGGGGGVPCPSSGVLCPPGRPDRV